MSNPCCNNCKFNINRICCVNPISTSLVSIDKLSTALFNSGDIKKNNLSDFYCCKDYAPKERKNNFSEGVCLY